MDGKIPRGNSVRYQVEEGAFLLNWLGRMLAELVQEEGSEGEVQEVEVSKTSNKALIQNGQGHFHCILSSRASHKADRSEQWRTGSITLQMAWALGKVGPSELSFLLSPWKTLLVLVLCHLWA